MSVKKKERKIVYGREHKKKCLKNQNQKFNIRNIFKN